MLIIRCQGGLGEEREVKKRTVVSTGGEYLVAWYIYTGDRVRVTRNMAVNLVNIYEVLQGDGMIVPNDSLMVVTYSLCHQSIRGWKG